jgi:hypothetical protein
MTDRHVSRMNLDELFKKRAERAASRKARPKLDMNEIFNKDAEHAASRDALRNAETTENNRGSRSTG